MTAQKLTPQEVIEALQRHQKWRLGDDSQPMMTPKELTATIDEAINLLSDKEKMKSIGLLADEKSRNEKNRNGQEKEDTQGGAK